ncbi:MAG TPA: GTP-binding protein, partial [Stellaceae bacterium]
ITKTDLADSTSVNSLRTRLAALNPATPQLDAARGAIDASALFGLGLFDPQTKSPDVQRWLNDEAVAANHNDETHEHAHEHHGDVNRHDARIRAFCITRDKPISWSSLSGWLDALASMRGDDLLRLKAIVAIAEKPDQPVVLHGVQHLFHPPVLLPCWPSEDRRTRLVFITRDLPQHAVEESFNAFAEADLPFAPARLPNDS